MDHGESAARVTVREGDRRRPVFDLRRHDRFRESAVTGAGARRRA
jgi:hypothetical protein